MSQAVSRSLLIVSAVALVSGLMGATAAAEPIDSGNLYGVYANSGSFDADGDFSSPTYYTIYHHLRFGHSLYPDALEPVEFPSAGAQTPTDLAEGAEFFLMGELGVLTQVERDGQFVEELVPAHFLVSSGGMGSEPPTNSAFDQDLQLMQGVLAVGSWLEGTGQTVAEIEASAFWDLMSLTSSDPADAFRDYFLGLGSDISSEEGPRGPVGRLAPGSYSFAGSEDLFGYTARVGTPSGAAGGSLGSIGYTDENGNTYAVPEPTTLALLLGGFVMGGALRRRKRRAA